VLEPSSQYDGPAIEVNELAFRFASNGDPVLEIPAWKVPQNDRVFLQGESGSGKSTLLALLAGLQVPTTGDISVLGTKISAMGNQSRDRFRARNIGVVFQQFNLIPYLSVIDNILLAAQFGDRGGDALRVRAAGLLDRVNLDTNFYERKASQLSIGQQQRVAIVRALINAPALLLVDEPTSALDHKNRDSFLVLLLEILEESSCSMVFVSHDPTIGQYFDHRLVLSEINQAPQGVR
jgi:putative ABC transport system ATP-binding protein